ncbi:MAG: alpha/beta hydrolase [Candidatus Aminicenantes bacterium]|nr:MAG: alpha/beta hydrolase [Candidatus Aminicenantes bacterium]
MKKYFKNKWCLFLIAGLILTLGCSRAQTTDSSLTLTTTEHELPRGKISQGSYAVFENREAGSGRMIHLDLVILHATGDDPKPDPLFYLGGGPGQANVSVARGYVESWIRRDRDIVLVNVRGTGGDNNLQCELHGGDDNIQGYLENPFDVEEFRVCLEELKQKFDLTKYSTPLAMDDLDDVRKALGYEKINLMGTSGGTRSILVYMRRHPETVRSAILIGVVPLAYRNPLYHPGGAQYAIDLLFKECSEDSACNEAFPNLEEEFWTVLERLEEGPVQVEIDHPVTEEMIEAELSLHAFTETIRSMMYSIRRSRSVPLYIHRAFLGNFKSITEEAVMLERGSQLGISLGLLLCVTCAEDVARIRPEDILRETKGSYRGDVRVRSQVAVCDIWPKSELPENYSDPVKVDIPVLLFSGIMDPVTPPRWGEEAARHLPNSLHVVVPGAHGVYGSCTSGIMQEFLTIGSAEGIDTSCVKTMTLPPFRIE